MCTEVGGEDEGEVGDPEQSDGIALRICMDITMMLMILDCAWSLQLSAKKVLIKACLRRSCVEKGFDRAKIAWATPFDPTWWRPAAGRRRGRTWGWCHLLEKSPRRTWWPP